MKAFFKHLRETGGTTKRVAADKQAQTFLNNAARAHKNAVVAERERIDDASKHGLISKETNAEEIGCYALKVVGYY